MQEITIQKWIDFYRSKKSMTKFISLLQKEDLMLLSFTPENLIIEENLPELGILEEDIKNILYEDVRLNNKLLFMAEEHDLYSDMSKFETTIKNTAQRKIIDEEDERSIFKTIMSKIDGLKQERLSEEEKEQKQKLKELTSSQKLLEVEKKVREDLEKEKEGLKIALEITKGKFYRELIEAKTRLVLALYHGADWETWKERYKDEFEQVIWSAVIQGEYELYGYEYPQIIKKLIDRKIVSSKDLMEFSIPRGVEEGNRYVIPDIKVNLIKKQDETETDFKKRVKEKEKELYKKELKKIQNDIARKVKINKIKILFGI